VLAGVNGAGKSSVGGSLLADLGLAWFNPDDMARELVATLKLAPADANAQAWAFGVAQLEAALAGRRAFAFETTLGGRTLPALMERAAATHDVVMLYVGLDSVEHHLQRVRLRVAHGGHDVPEARVRDRWLASRANLVRLLPCLARLQVFDNSAEAAPGAPIPDPLCVLELDHGRVLWPDAADGAALAATPAWARPIVQAAIELVG